MTFAVRWMPRARRQAAETQQWWITHRELAPTMFLAELARVIALLQEDPHLGIRVQGREIRRILLPDTKRFLYYRVRPRAQRIEIVALWGAVRELGPPLPPDR